MVDEDSVSLHPLAQSCLEIYSLFEAILMGNVLKVHLEISIFQPWECDPNADDENENQLRHGTFGIERHILFGVVFWKQYFVDQIVKNLKNS